MSEPSPKPAKSSRGRHPSEELLPMLYDELRRLAAQRIAQEHPGQTLQATALVHEAYLRLVSGPGSSEWHSRAHFFSAAAEAMRRILIDSARRKSRIKHGGELRRVPLEDRLAPSKEESLELLAMDEALEAFAAIDPAKAELVKLRYFAGFTLEEAAALLSISPETAKRHWAYARAWLYRWMTRQDSSSKSRLDQNDRKLDRDN